MLCHFMDDKTAQKALVTCKKLYNSRQQSQDLNSHLTSGVSYLAATSYGEASRRQERKHNDTVP